MFFRNNIEMKHGKKIELDELKRIELDILKFVDSFCREKGISYSLTGGTLLGAIRHKGFIPWDDDIDIMLDRKNYNQFIEGFPAFSQESDYELITYKNQINYNYLHSKVINKRTTLIEDHNKYIDRFGVFIDVFPIDSITDNYDESRRKLKRIQIKKYLTVASNWRHFYINTNRGMMRQIPRFFFYLISRFSNPKKQLAKIEQDFKNNDIKKYCACICGVYDIDKELMESSIFNDYIEVQFEGNPFSAIKEYDTYLRSLYGNYLELPPIEKRRPQHTFVAYHNIQGDN